MNRQKCFKNRKLRGLVFDAPPQKHEKNEEGFFNYYPLLTGHCGRVAYSVVGDRPTKERSL